MLDASAGHDVLRGRKIWFSAFSALSFLQVLNIRLTPREKRLEWKGKMANGKWVRGGRDKGMDSALWVMQGADGSRVCVCFGSFCSSQEFAEERVVELVSASPRAR